MTKRKRAVTPKPSPDVTLTERVERLELALAEQLNILRHAVRWMAAEEAVVGARHVVERCRQEYVALLRNDASRQPVDTVTWSTSGP